MTNTGPAKPPTRAAKKTAKKAAKKTTKKVAAKKSPAKKDAKTLSGPGSEKRDMSKASKPRAQEDFRDPLKANSTDPLKMPEKRARESLQRVYQLQGEVDRMGDRAEAAKAKHDAAKQQLKDAEKALHKELHQQKAGAGPLFE